MKVLDVADFFSERGGGVRSYLSTLACEGRRRGHDVVIVAPGPRDETVEFNGGRLIRLAGPPLPYDPSYHAMWRIDRVRRIVREEDPDVLQASSPYLPALIVSSVDKPLRSFVFHSDQIATYLTPLLRRLRCARIERAVRSAANAWPRSLMRRFDVTIAPSAEIERSLLDAGGVRVKRVTFGISTEQFGPDRRDPELRARMMGSMSGMKSASLAVVACRLAIEKRVDEVIDAIAIVNRQRPVALVVLGDGPERRRLEAAARRLPQVSFLGFSKDRAEYARMLASADVFVHGGAAETFGFALGEALVSGLPIVVPAAGAALDFAALGASETYEPYRGPAAIAQAMERALDLSLDQRRASAQLAAGQIRSASEHFDELFAVYAQMLAQPRPGRARR